MTPNTIYSITTSTLESEGNLHTTYGIAGNKTEFKDVSVDRAKVEEMVARLNKEQLEESQLMYFISDEIDR